IHSEGEDEKRASVDQEHVQRQYLEDFLTQIDWITDEAREAIYQSGHFDKVDQLAHASADDLAETASIESASAQEIIDGAREYMDALAEMTRSNYGHDDSILSEASDNLEITDDHVSEDY